MTILEMRAKTEQELKEEVKKLEKELQAVVTAVLQKKEKNFKKPREVKRNIARVKTVLTEKKVLG